MAEMTFYPDAHVETSSVDGAAIHNEAEVTWATILAGAGNRSDDALDGIHHGYFNADGGTNKWVQLHRPIYVIDISGLPPNAIITGVIFSLYGYDKADGLSTAPDFNIYSSNPASNIAIVVGDYDSLGTTPYCDTPITYANFKVADPFWNDFIFNAAGIAAVQAAADGDGILKLGSRSPTYDVAAGTPNWVQDAVCYMSTYAADKGAGYKPKLVVTYAPTPVTDGDLIGIGIIRKT